MKMKLDFVVLCMLFFVQVLGYSSDTPPSPGTPNNNLHEDCDPCTETEAKSSGVGNHGPLWASAEGHAWKTEDGAAFKWRSTSIVKNTDSHIKGTYMFMYGVPHTRVVVIIERDDLVNVDADPKHFCFHDRYEGECGAVFAVQSTKPFTIQNAKIEVNNMSATSYIDGKPLSDNDPNSPNKYEASADTPTCICNDNDGGNNEENNNNLGIFPTDPNQSPSPGESYEVRLTTDTPYSQVYWYVKAPWETSYYGTNVEIDYGDGSTTEASLTNTFPSGAMHTGEFIITAYIYRSDQSVYEETYTVNVTMP